MFYLWAILLLTAAAVLVFAALRRRATPIQEKGATTVAAVYQDRLEELRREMSGGMVAQGEQEVLEAELGAALLADVDVHGGGGADDAAARTSGRAGISSETSGSGSAALALASAVLLIAISILVYSVVGDPEAMSLAGAEVVFDLDPAEDKDLLNEWRERLNRRVDDKPGDAKSWYLLGHVDLRLARFNSAAEAFAMAREAHGGEDPSIDIFWLQARYMAAGGVLDATSRGIADRVLATNPNQPLVLEMYAIDAFRREAYEESVSLLNRALSNPTRGNHLNSLEVGFSQARERLGVLPGAVDVAIESAVEIPRGMTLFVIARPVGGGMPFAVVRRPATGLPRTIRLDDAVSMNPAAPLSAAGEVEIVVRLSRSGTAMAHPGDWEWQSEPFSPADSETPRQLMATLEPPA